MTDGNLGNLKETVRQAVRVQGARRWVASGILPYATLAHPWCIGTAMYKGEHEGGEAGFRAACCEPLNAR